VDRWTENRYEPAALDEGAVDSSKWRQGTPPAAFREWYRWYVSGELAFTLNYDYVIELAFPLEQRELQNSSPATTRVYRRVESQEGTTVLSLAAAYSQVVRQRRGDPAAERADRARSVHGKYAYLGITTDEFISEKQEIIRLEQRDMG